MICLSVLSRATAKAALLFQEIKASGVLIGRVGYVPGPLSVGLQDRYPSWNMKRLMPVRMGIESVSLVSPGQIGDRKSNV